MGRLEDKDVYVSSTRDSLAESAAADLTLFPKGTVLFTKSGMSTLLNQRAILGRDMNVVSHIGTCVPLGELPSEWVFYWLKTVDFKDLTHATTLPSLQLPKVKAIEMPLAPLPEQRRIVAKIEELFSQLDAGVEELKKAKAQLKRYRLAVLRAAFEGALTSDWRLANSDKIEPAAKLLERIREERKKALGKKYKEPPALDTSALPELPEGWAWIDSESLFAFVTSGSRGWAKYYTDTGATFIRIGNLDHGSISLDLRDIQYVNPPGGTEGTRTRVQPGDILVSITADVGMIALVQHDIGEAYINQHVALARPVEGYVRPYAAWFLAAEEGGQRQLKGMQRGATKVGLGLDDIKHVAVPLTSIAEQHEVVAEIERRFSVADAEEKTIEAALAQAARLRQSILKRAFEGRLVPQDPSDEPASRLLNRIREARAKEPTANRQRAKRRKGGAQ
jgi:type I restriction enzyme S subunit